MPLRGLAQRPILVQLEVARVAQVPPPELRPRWVQAPQLLVLPQEAALTLA